MIKNEKQNDFLNFGLKHIKLCAQVLINNESITMLPMLPNLKIGTNNHDCIQTR